MSIINRIHKQQQEYYKEHHKLLPSIELTIEQFNDYMEECVKLKINTGLYTLHSPDHCGNFEGTDLYVHYPRGVKLK